VIGRALAEEPSAFLDLARVEGFSGRGVEKPRADGFVVGELLEECEFLIANLATLEACLRDNRLRQRAKTIRARSRSLADAVAGSVHLNRKASTAAEYLSAERLRLLRRACCGARAHRRGGCASRSTERNSRRAELGTGRGRFLPNGPVRPGRIS
jgi:hypothetical protein